MYFVCSDLEGVFVPEIWIEVAERLGIPELKLTTRDISDYDELMRKRLRLLHENKIKLQDIQNVIEQMSPFESAREFLDWLRQRTQVVIVSDTFIEFAQPLMKQLGWPTLFCNSLVVDDEGNIIDYKIRLEDGKKKLVESLSYLNYEVIAMGDSYNDINMLRQAEHGLLFSPPENVVNEFPHFPVANDYEELKSKFKEILR